MHRYLCVFGLLVAIVLTTCQDPPTVDADQPQESSFTNAKLKEQKDLEVEDPNDTVERRAFRRATNPLVDFSFIPGLALRRVRGQDSQDTTPTTLSGRFTQPECAQRCSRDPDCKAFQHNHKRSLCQLFSATLNYVHSTAYYERKLTAAEIAADERVLFASEVDESVQHLSKALEDQHEEYAEQLHTVEKEEMTLRIRKVTAEQALKGLERKLMQDPTNTAVRDDLAKESEKLAQMELMEAALEGRKSVAELNLKQRVTALEQGHRQQQEARKDAQMATNNFAIEESMRLLNSSRAELVAIRRARQKRLARASQASEESAIVQPADPEGSLTGYIDGISIKAFSKLGSNGTVKLAAVGTRGTTILVPLADGPIKSGSTISVKLEVGSIGPVVQLHLAVLGDPTDTWLPCTVEVVGDQGITRQALVQRQISGGEAALVDLLDRPTCKMCVGLESEQCTAEGQSGCKRCLSPHKGHCTACNGGYFLSHVTPSCDGKSYIGQCKRYPRIGRPAIKACTPGFESSRLSPPNLKVCTAGASEWSYFKVNEFSNDMVKAPKRVLALNVRLYKKVSASVDANGKQDGSSTKNAECYLLCYMTQIDAFSNPEAQATQRRLGKPICPWTATGQHSCLEDKGEYACVGGGVSTKVSAGFWRGQGCCFKGCNVPDEVEAIVPGISKFVVDSDPVAWSEFPLSVY